MTFPRWWIHRKGSGDPIPSHFALKVDRFLNMFCFFFLSKHNSNVFIFKILLLSTYVKIPNSRFHCKWILALEIKILSLLLLLLLLLLQLSLSTLSVPFFTSSLGLAIEFHTLCSGGFGRSPYLALITSDLW